ncbi:Dph6-related ATP pyrophosphatase [Rubinisphaera brasiliensis]|uniref:Diphthamide synthase domain-containing protein n=1 Tax=Rubinisphaera brasiliensis (strain ATCC 49424 / DSM 5305 / JCM 21570 / IAM 15109 / NBRC 103401 / IFAM 1448) TaxID=756272 RepID=F0SSS3_RUBBR|nr:ATPase [Rubinisphaera brasiliensis]ADY61401.1 protein of unknown function DUF71 ATP-binding region [Rubinisphaera brasiliensis DSM 5305]
MNVLVSWSSGKDSSWMLHQLQQSEGIQLAGLLTTVNSDNNRVAMHGVRHALVEEQAALAELELWSVPLPFPCSNSAYEETMGRIFVNAAEQDIDVIAFGDLYLADIRKYRERQLRPLPIKPIFPIWLENGSTQQLAQSMIQSGFRTILTCVDSRQLSPEFLGREFDEQFLRDLPASVDPCGENGEFHTFCYAGPHFDGQVNFRTGETVERDGFYFLDLVSGDACISET